MKTCIIYGIIGALMAWFFMYLDTRLLDNPKTKTTYAKNMCMVGFIIAFGIYLIGEEGFEKAVGITDVGFGGGGSYDYDYDRYGGGDYMHGINEEIMTGSPNF